MIQRIQSVYFLLAAAALVLMFFFPLSLHSFRGLEVAFNLLEKTSADQLSASMMINLWPLLTAVILIIILCLLTIFLYKNRPLQLRLAMISVLLNILLIITVFWMVNYLSTKLDPESVDQQINYQFGVYLPIVSLVFLILAHRGIKKDERMIKAADRIR